MVKIHRIGGPAIICENGDKFWCQYGKYHREDGPAAEYDGWSEYWLNNYPYLSKEEWFQALTSEQQENALWSEDQIYGSDN